MLPFTLFASVKSKIPPLFVFTQAGHTTLLNSTETYIKYVNNIEIDTDENILEVVCILTAVAQAKKAVPTRAVKVNEKKNKPRTVWSRFWLMRRDQGKDIAALVMKELQYEDLETFRNFNRMYPSTFHHLLEKLRCRIKKQDTVMRQAVPVETRLLMTLRFLATGDSFLSLSCAFRVSVPAITLIIQEGVEAIISSLAGDYMKLPQTTEDWLRVSDELNVQWNFPHCLGALDGKHIAFRDKKSDGSLYFNYKGFNSIVLLALVDANHNFLYVDIGCNGRANDASVYNASSLCSALEQNKLNIPPDAELKENGTKVSYVIVADEAFKLQRWLMKPHRQKTCNVNKIFNYRLSRARRVVENAFGILSNRFRILQATINLSAEKVEKLVYATCILHNYLKSQERDYVNGMDSDNTDEVVFTPGEWRSMQPLTGLAAEGNRSAEEPRIVRDELTKYFNTTGAVPWQADAIERVARLL